MCSSACATCPPRGLALPQILLQGLRARNTPGPVAGVGLSQILEF